MIVFMEWNASSYAVAGPDDRERMSSIKEAKKTFWRRADYDPAFPCVENSKAYLYLRGRKGDNDEAGGEYPDYRLYMGPRGGVRMERC